jgi:hypothetical protein
MNPRAQDYKMTGTSDSIAKAAELRVFIAGFAGMNDNPLQGSTHELRSRP